MKNLTLLLLVFTFSLASCKKEVPQTETIPPSNYSILNIGVWDMDESVGVFVDVSSIDVSKIISVDIEIISDNGAKTGLLSHGMYLIEGNTIYLMRDHDGYFHQTAFDDDSINRGNIRFTMTD